MARAKKRKYRMDAGEPDTKELDSTHDWGVIADDELNPPE